MKHFLRLVPIFLGLSTFTQITLAQTGEKNFIDQNYIEVTGKAEMQIVPDLIYIQVRISERDKKEPIASVEKRMLDKFQEIGVDTKKDLSVNDFLSRFRNKVFAKDIVISKEYQLVVHDANMASKVFLELEKLEISNVSIDHIDHTKIEEFRRELKINAVKAAKDKAEAITKAINQAIGKAIFIQELDYVSGSTRQSNVMLRGYSSAVHYGVEPKYEADIDFEKIKLEYSILVRFELK